MGQSRVHYDAYRNQIKDVDPAKNPKKFEALHEAENVTCVAS